MTSNIIAYSSCDESPNRLCCDCNGDGNALPSGDILSRNINDNNAKRSDTMEKIIVLIIRFLDQLIKN